MSMPSPGNVPPDGSREMHASTREYTDGDERRFVVAVDLRTFSKEEVEAKYNGRTVVVHAGPNPYRGYEIKERFTAPEGARIKDVVARFNNGILTITVPVDE